MGPWIWSVGCRPMIAAFKLDAAGKLGPLSNPVPGPVPTPPATPPSLPGGGVKGLGGSLVRSVVSERCAPPGSVHVTVSSGSASNGSAAGGLGVAGGGAKGLGRFGGGGGGGGRTSAPQTGGGGFLFQFVFGGRMQSNLRALRGFWGNTNFTLSPFTSG